MKIEIRRKIDGKYALMTDDLVYDVYDSREDAETAETEILTAIEIRDKISNAIDNILALYSKEEIEMFIEFVCANNKFEYDVKFREIQ